MNKKLTALYIIMIFVGLGMLFVISNRDSSQTNLVNQPDATAIIQPIEEKTENIVVVRALKDLPAGSLLRDADYQIETIEVSVNSSEKLTFALSFTDIAEYGIQSSIKQGSLIPMASLVPPTSADYFKMSLREGMFVYPFSLIKSDNYLLNNLKQGDSIDIYINYGINNVNMGLRQEVELTSPSRQFLTTRMKPIVANRRVLLINRATDVEVNGVTDKLEGSQLFVELSLQEIKLLKGLENNAKIFIFPTPLVSQDLNDESLILHGTEAVWPVTTSEIFDFENFAQPTKSREIKEYRGN